ncbi:MULTISPECIES: patatin-like phospholipase family protein [Methylocaldum]|jgi:predicted acylesterase/phospholipase RssA|uniref:patatin-like phospholipase family protein n=1 Tax=unclassified Methylocaldum TaxID=2622260 RepID=UPI00098BB112|nr:patatin-like phospholipase family protein [Methylocaldum sp. 14B]MDV3241242.1 patatin-like phospholipase family protein [Methylocaldum sp.]MVF21194.1 patatin-like phospholipase family protein [Methylocaldum sp. BRCS4]
MASLIVGRVVLAIMSVRNLFKCLLFVLLILAAGCGPALRPSLSQQELLSAREASDRLVNAEIKGFTPRLVTRAKQEYDDYVLGVRSEPPVIDALVISGGGDWGAFGAGFLKGWGRVPKGPMARPEFDVVTGVSTGALIAPFAFLGTERTIDQVLNMYREPRPDIVKLRGLLFFLPRYASFTRIPGLERDIAEAIDSEFLNRIVREGRRNRMLLVNTTNLDDGDMRAWDVVEEARSALRTGDVDRVHRILLASAAVPGVFPPREIDGRLYVDGGVTGNILYGARTHDEDSFSAVWKKTYPDLPIPKQRYWVILNNQFRFLPQITRQTWAAIMRRSTNLATQSATVNALRHLYALAEISKLKRGADVEIRVISVPADWTPPKPGVFVKETMNALADLGERMGANPSSWRTEPP